MTADVFTVDMTNLEDVQYFSEVIAEKLQLIVSDCPSGLDADAVKRAIEDYVSDLIKPEAKNEH